MVPHLLALAASEDDLPAPELEYVGRRDPGGVESYSLYSGHIIVQCRTPTGDLQVAMSPEALTGFLAWLEAAPPGQRRRTH